MKMIIINKIKNMRLRFLVKDLNANICSRVIAKCSL